MHTNTDNFKKFQNYSKQEINSLFSDACTNDDQILIKYLLTSTDLKHNADIHFNDDFALRTACRKGQLDFVRYYLTSPDLKEHADIDVKDNYPFNMACSMDYLELVKYLLTAPNLKKHANLDIAGFANACSYGNLDIVKYLLTSSDLNEHIDLYGENNKGFRWAVENNQYEVLRFLIIDMEMTVNEPLKKYLEFHANHEVNQIFELAALNRTLKDELATNNVTQRKAKI
jgi:ankyrin repeat protein